MPIKNQSRSDRHDRAHDWDDDRDDDDHRRYQKNGYYGSGKYH